MHARDRNAIKLGIFALVLFILHWPLDNSVCNPDTWKYRPPVQEGVDFFGTIFRGGGGTPAIFAMLGGQRYLVANIIWTYSDVLFHQGKPREMVQALEATVTLNPSFTDAWSVYGWHLAWNLHSYTEDQVEKMVWLKKGEGVYKRAVKNNPLKPQHYFDLAWLYATRTFEYDKALPPLQEVVESRNADGSYQFPPATGKMLKDIGGISDRYWVPQKYGNRLAYVYRKMYITTRKKEYLDKAIATYEESKKLDPNDVAADNNIKELREKGTDPAWLQKQLDSENKTRESYGTSKVFVKSPLAEKYGVERESRPKK
ncbi:MAG: tetratricopeptide repeat protein [Armatimonadota bacterium]